MRSILKSHKRTDSSVSDSNVPLEPPYIKTSSSKSSGSPTLSSSIRMTPPMSASGFHQPTKSSPKKLLTPIKKMFGHHSKSTVVPHTADTLQSVIHSDFEPPRAPRFFRSKQNSFSDLSDLRTSDASSQGNTVLASSSSYSFDGPQKPVQNSSKPKVGFGSTPYKATHSRSNVSLESRDRRKAEMHIISLNTSELSIATSKSSLKLSPPKAEAVPAKRVDTGASYEADDDSKDSDTSSQFSFVKDIRGGRNTSVKYYKTRTKSCADGAGSPHNYFNVDDTGFEADALSDYDFENNGIGDDGEFDDEFPNGADRFGDFLSDKASYDDLEEIDTSNILPLTDTQDFPGTGCSDENIALQPPETPHDDLSKLRSPEYAGDFLDAYLESRSPLNSSNSVQGETLPHNYDQFGSNLSVADTHMGLGIAMSNDESHDAASIPSVTNMMDMLKNLEGSDLETAAPAFGGELHESTNHSTPSTPKPSTSLDTKNYDDMKAQNRQSVADMMATLSLLGGSFDNPAPVTKTQEGPEKPKSKSPPKKKQRYSWLSNDDSFGKDAYGDASGETPTIITEDLIDEINMLPENFDFNDDSIDWQENEHNSFMRSNSYNKKPKKVVQDHSFQEKKIELHNKTVTFYRSKSLDREDRCRNVARAASLRSVTSFNDEDISEADEDDYFDFKEMSLDQRLGSPSYVVPLILTPQKSGSLEPITESETPKLG